jgi:NAD(P)-dependent dehydrogenase (short-subunit alcohol dehydrogenase family)
MRLKDKTAIVTGAASGIGKAIALALAAEGADVVILDIDQPKSEEVVTQIREQGRRAYFVRCDVGFADQVQNAFAEAIRLLGKLDILVNNTGVVRFSQIVDTPEEDWDFVLRTNLKSVFLCSQQAAQQMIQQGHGGRIIAISSIHAALSEPDAGPYAASKGGIEAFCRTLASEVAPHKITVNFVRPGATLTELTVPLYTPSIKRALFERIPLKEIAEPSWIAAGVVFLASGESRYMTGQHLTIDGGYMMDGSLPHSLQYDTE